MTQRRILVVDDSFIMRRLVSDIVASDPLLTVAGTAENGRVALQMVRQLKPDLVLLDIEMPEMSGLETLRRLGLRSPCPVIVLSSLVEGQSREREEAMRLGAAACIGKPSGAISMDIQDKRASEVLATVRRVLSLPPIEAATAAGEPSGQAPALLEALLAGVQDGVLAFDSHARLTSCNEQARTLMRRPDLQAGTTRLDDVFDDFNAGLAADIRAVLAGGEAFGPDMTDYAAPDGDWHPVTLSARPLPDGNGGPGVLALLADASERRRLRALLERTASAAVTDALLAGAGEASVRIATILFSDIRGYTALAEALGAAGIVALLNEYFSFMADVVRDAGGVIDKFIGDAIMALFGVPASRSDDPDRAVRAALGMLDALDLVNRAGGAQGRPPVAIGIGLATGEVVAGAIGSPDRMNYTVIGDAANLASRLEGQTKPYRAAILACGRTVAALRQKPPCRLLDVVRVKGQATPTEVWEIFRAPPDRASAEAYAAGLDAYRAGRFVPAADDFGRALAARPGDAAAAMLRDRCVRLRDDPPAGWDGAWTLTEK